MKSKIDVGIGKQDYTIFSLIGFDTAAVEEWT